MKRCVKRLQQGRQGLYSAMPPAPDHHIAMSTKNPISRTMKSNVSTLK
jgi:hypothetical protein